MRHPLRQLLLPALLAVLASGVVAQTVQNSCNATKNASADNIYHDNDRTLYCGCTYESHDDSDGAGDVDMADCGMEALPLYANRTDRIEWEHIVPASLVPARQMSCWENPEQFDDCVSESGNVKDGRSCCEKVSQVARNMIFDLHNLAPAIGQVNAYRLNDRYGVVAEDPSPEQWPGCDAQHFRAASESDHRFEPGGCTKGDVARVWF